MKKINKLLSVLMVVLMLTCSMPLQGFVGLELPEFGLTAQAATITSYNTGDIIEFGWYPQSEVTDADTIAALNAADGEWISYNYYSGTGEFADGNMTASDYMHYKDVFYNGNKYRGVIFDSYRPYFTGSTSSASNTYQDDNGYSINTAYWFKYDPIRWRVLDPIAGMVMSEIILDSQAYNNYIVRSGEDDYGYTAFSGDAAKTYYANNYEKSSIRAWLNADFYNTAFSSAQQNIISVTTLNNSAYSYSWSICDSAATNDKIYLLSYSDTLKTNYGFSSSTGNNSGRNAQGSSYAKSQGLSVKSGNSFWNLRTAGCNSSYCCVVTDNGYINEAYYTYNTSYGVRPVFNFDLSSEIFQSDIVDFGDESTENECEHLNIETLAEKMPTCTTTGLTEGKKCSDCDEILVEQVEIPVLDHTFTNWKTDYKVGDIVQFGSYPQSEMKDEGLIAELNARAPEWDNWVSYGYYSGNNSDGSMVQGDWMRYTDVTYNGEKYRGVKFTQYRPYSTTSSSSKTKSYQDENGYNLNTSYWFRFEPIKWRVLDVNTGFVVSEYLLDTQAYNNTVYYNSNSTESKYAYFNDSSYTNYASDYATSSIRDWLNNYFYCTAFTAAQGNQIKTTSIDNNGYFTSQGTAGYERLDGEATEDKIFLLSSNDVKNRKYGFSSSEQSSSTTREALGSDYAKIQGLYKINGYNSSFWFLRTPGYNSKSCCLVNELGYFYGNYNGVTNLDSGVRPSLCLNDLAVTDSRYVLPSCSANGSITYTCECGEVKVETIDALEHTFSDWEITKESTKFTEGEKVRVCSVCQTTETQTIEKLPTNPEDILNSGTCGADVTWTLYNDGTLLISGTGSMKNYSSYGSNSTQRSPWYSYERIIKEIIIEDNVTTIGNYAFYNCYNLTSISLADSVTHIGDFAFMNCKALTSIEIPSGVTSIGHSVFKDCALLVDVYFEANSQLTIIGEYAFDSSPALKRMVIPDRVTTIDKYAFANCPLLTEVFISAGVIQINGYAFYNDTSLTNICFEENSQLTSIGSNAFAYCSALENIYLPDSIKKLGGSLFVGCPKVTTINYPKNLTICSEGTTAGPFAKSSIVTIVFPEGLTTIASYSFVATNSITNMVLPDSVETIGSYAFYNADNLESIQLSENLKIIGSDAFAFCDSLTTINFNDKLETIGSYAFEYCPLLETLELPDNIMKIERTVFKGCDKLKKLNYPKNLNAGAFAFEHSFVEEIVVPDGVEKIADEVFANCSTLKSIVIPDSVTTIGYGAFNSCGALETIVIPDTVTTIEKSAFGGCTNLKNLTLPADLISIGDFAFNGCSSLTSVVFPSKTKSIGCSAFKNCTSLQSVVLADSINSLSYSLFENCPLLTVINYPKNLSSVGVNSSIHRDVGPFTDSSITTVIVPDDTKSIARNAFLGHTALQTIELPEGLESIGWHAFRSCSSLQKLTIPKTVTNFSTGTISSNTIVFCYYLSTTHKYMENLNSTKYKYEIIFDHEHDNTELVVNPPTCTSDGIKTITCNICGYVTEEITPATGHPGEWVETKVPTMFETGELSKTCSVCQTIETMVIDKIPADPNDENFGTANFTIVNAITKDPIQNANIFVSTDTKGETTFYTDAEGKVSIVLPVGANIITAHAKGLISRTLTVDIVHGENEIPAIGLGSSPIVEAELVTTPMTKEEIIDAGIDVTAPGNNNVIKYEVTFEFKAQEPEVGGGEPPKTTITETFYVNSNGDHYYQNNNQSNTYEIFGEPVTIHPTERFYLIITGDIIWLKEMFHVQLYAYNNSNTDWIEDVVATLQPPEGLSLADMVDGEQTLAQQMGTIAEGDQADCEWYVRGDKEGIYDLTATLTGRIMPFGEDFSNEYTAEEAIRVYSGKGLSISFEVPTTTYCGDEYPVKIILENISDKPIYNVAHVLTGISQTKVTHYTNGEIVEEIYVKDSLDKAAFVDEFNPGDQLVLELTANILFESEVYKDCIFELVDIIFNAKELGEAINNNFGFPTEHDWGEWETVTEPTCGEAGLEKRVCNNNADHVETKEIEVLPHDWDDGVIEPVSTCKDYGVKTYTCKNDASHTKTEVVPLDPDNHIVDTYIKDAADNTCEEDGYTGNIHCAGCHVKLSDGEVIPAHGHDYQKIDAKCKAPDYGVAGYDYYECSYDASHWYTVEVAPLVKTTFTATFVTIAPFFKEDKIVAEVTFVQGDKFVEEPAVDKYDNYTFAWDEYELKDEDIVIYGRYTEIEINDITTPEAEKKAEINNGVATITLEAKANSKNIKILSEKTKPVDVILVLDQSGSMAETLSSNGKTKREALIECANDFVKELYDNAVATGAEHRVAVVGFSYSDYNGGNYKNTGILATANGKSINYKSLKDADYASALMSVAIADGINANITKGINSVVADGATSAHLGLEMANNIFAMTEKQAGRERIVLFITDGTPTSWGEETDLVKTTAAKAITEANELKNAQGAKIYSIGVHANAEPTANFTSDEYGVATDNRGNFKSYDFNRFLHAVSSNYPTAGSIRVSEMGDGSKNAGYYLGVQDTSKLSEIFSKILLSSVYEVRTFDKVTIVDTVSKEFTLTLEQETEMRERLIADLGIRNEDITVTRNADGTTTLRFDNVRTQKIYNEDGSSYYSAKISFDVSADEDSLGLTEVKTNTTDAGVEFDGETIEKFEIPTVVLEPDRKLIVFTVNGVVYRIEEAKLGDGIVAPESTLAEWNIPEGTVVDSDYVVFEANAVESTAFTVTWVSENSKITQTYSFGDAIAIPAAAEKAEYEFLKWSPDVPATMPNYSITFTAVYTPKHSHVYNKAYTFGKCTEGITTVYECACGDSYEETAPVTEHSAKAVIEQTNNGTLIEKVTCQICGTTNSQELTYKVTYKDGWRNTVLDLTLLDNDVSVQPDGTLEIRFYVGEKINKNYTVYRIDENGRRTSYTPRKENGYLIFDADHFSFYVVAELDEETGEIIDEATYEEVYCVSNGHDYAAVTTAPTCTEDGFTTYTCSVCGDSYVENETAALGHKEVTVSGKAATCTQTGLTDGVKCSVCGETLTAQTVIDKLSHKDDNGDYKCDYGCGHEFDRPATPDQPSDNTCNHLCHKDGFVGFIWKIIRFFWKLFKMNPVCECGAAHY